MSSSAGTIDADVNITINAEDNATVKVESAARKINRQWRELRLEQRAVQQSFELSNRKFVASARVLNQVGSIVGRVQSVFNTFQLAQLRLDAATQGRIVSEKALSDSIRDNGLFAQETIDLAEQNIQQKKREQEAIDGTNAAWILNAAVIATLIGRIPRLTGAFKVLNRTIKGTPKVATPTAGPGAGKSSAGSALSRFAGKALPGVGAGAAGFGIGALVQILSDIQPAFGGRGEGELPGGLDAIGPLLGKASNEGGKIINNIINVFASTSQEIVTQIEEGVQRITRFSGQ